MNLAEYLKSKHLEYCNQVGDIVYESDWIKNELNTQLPEGDKISVASFNQWINGDRSPDSKNIVRLIKVFGPEVMPYLGITFYGGLGEIVSSWDNLTEEDKNEIHKIVSKDGTESAPVKVVK
jgi:hypothetical protein